MSLTITRNYSDGNTLTEQQLDDAFDSIETFLNVTGIGQDGIQDNAIGSGELQANSVTASKIAADAVTTVKLLDEAVTSAKIASGTIERDRLLAALQYGFNPIGTVITFAGTSAPTGYLSCDGSAVSRTTYADLFGVIGTVHGSGNGTTTFHLPDYRGRFLRGRDAGAGRDPDASSRTASNSGGNTGDAVGSVQGDQYKSHSHGQLTFSGAGGNNGPENTVGAFNTAAVSTATSGGNETRPVNANVLYCIKY